MELALGHRLARLERPQPIPRPCAAPFGANSPLIRSGVLHHQPNRRKAEAAQMRQPEFVVNDHLRLTCPDPAGGSLWEKGWASVGLMFDLPEGRLGSGDGAVQGAAAK